MGEYYSSNSPAAFTKSKMGKMGHSSAIGDPDGNKDPDTSEKYGKAPGPSDISELKKGGKVKKAHLGRAGRSTGGRVGRADGGKVGKTNTNMKDDESPIRMGEYPKLRARGGKVHDDEPEDRELVDKMVKPSALRSGRASGGRTKGKGKTVVNVIIGGKGDQDKPQGGPPMAPMVPPPPPAAPPQPPPHPPGAPMAGGPPPMMPPGGAPMGPAGAPPGGMPPPPMRKSGGRVNNLGHYLHPAKAGFSDSKAPHRGGGKEGFSDTKPTSKRAPMASGSKSFKVKLDPNERAGNNGQGRIEKAARQA